MSRDDIVNMPSEDIVNLVYELQINQIELAIQNQELQQAQKTLEVLNSKYYDLYDLAPVGYITLDRKHIILETNLMAGKLLGCERSRLCGKSFNSFFHPDSQDTYHLHYQNVFHTAAYHSCELELIGSEERKFIQLHSLMVTDNREHCRTVISDITTLKNTEAELVQSRDQALSASQAKSEFLANMSHEMRTPLNAIIGLIYILMQSNPLTPDQKKYISTLQVSADSLLMLINELLDLTKIETSSVEFERISFHLPELLRETFHIMELKAKEKGLALSLDIDPKLHPIYYGDPMRIRQIVLNLLSNAVKFTESGKIILRMRGLQRGNDRMDIIISVSDTGIGIPREKHECVFENFVQADASTTRKFGGTGLGLAISKKLTEQMHGKISVDSAPGKGSTFTVRLPLIISLAPAAKLSISPQPELSVESLVTDKKPHILLVEDNPSNALIATTYLDVMHCTYDTAACGAEALQKFKEKSYSLILMDIQMHDMDGYEVASTIRTLEKEKALPATPIIAITAHTLRDDRQKCLSAGMNDYITKPLLPEELQRKIKKFLEFVEA